MLLLNLAYKKRRKHATHLLPPALEQQRNDEDYPRLIRSTHRLAAIRVALAAGINLLGMALMAFIAIQLAMRGIVRIVRLQIGSLLSKRLIAIAVTRQTRIVVDIIAIGQAQMSVSPDIWLPSSATWVLMSALWQSRHVVPSFTACQ